MDALDRRERLARAARIGVPILVVSLVAVGLWRLASDTAGVRRETAAPSVVALTPPPPPPPPPPKERPPEPPKPNETPAPSPDPKPDATPKSDAPKQLTINGPAQAGTDAFGVAAGRGGGVAVGGDPNGSDRPGGGGGFAEAGYARYLDGALQRIIQGDERVNRLAFMAQVQIWIRPDGSIAKVNIIRSSGDARTDRALLAAIETVGRLDQAPPPQLKFPARVLLRGRRT